MNRYAVRAVARYLSGRELVIGDWEASDFGAAEKRAFDWLDSAEPLRRAGVKTFATLHRIGRGGNIDPTWTMTIKRGRDYPW